MVVHLDDILVFSSNKKVHMDHLCVVLKRLQENSLFAKPEKCSFFVKELSFLWFILSGKGFRLDPGKVRAIVDWVQPRDLKGLQRFLRFANYYRKFIKRFSQVVKPLTDLTHKGADPKKWSALAVAEFALLKKCFMSAPVLVQPDPSELFIIEVDASEVKLGAVLSQGSITLTNLRPCAFFF
ncbi:uncharacterized protein [Dendrobates tinctorius]|uniref:uncharacterized protein n=1 Tax=Dendrobates tinctorius TaxID=92724 RepID=UPI003CC9C910